MKADISPVRAFPGMFCSNVKNEIGSVSGWASERSERNQDPCRAQRAQDESRHGSKRKKKRFPSSFGVLKDLGVCVSPLPVSAPLPWASSLCARQFGESPPLPGTQQEHDSSLSRAELNFFRGRKGRRKIKNSPVMWRAESPPEDSWHNNLNDQMIQRRLVSAETAS